MADVNMDVTEAVTEAVGIKVHLAVCDGNGPHLAVAASVGGDAGSAVDRAVGAIDDVVTTMIEDMEDVDEVDALP